MKEIPTAIHAGVSISPATADSASGSAAATVAAVVVTFNRKRLLAECLDALLNQTKPPDCIFVIDQASTDGTKQMLQEMQFLSSPVIQYTYSETNTGGAGGFHHGMQMAYREGFDWIWVMDDDAIADRNSLERMLRYAMDPKVIAIANTKIRNNGVVDENHVIFDGPAGRRESPPALRYSSFVGLMVSRIAIDSVGLPKAEFFYQHDDVEYCRRLCMAGKIVLAKDAPILHKEAGRLPPTAIWCGRKVAVYPTDQFCIRHYFFQRNVLWTELHGRKRQPTRLVVVAAQALRIAFKIALVDRPDVWLRLFIHARAIIDAAIGRFDNELAFRIRDRIVARNRGSK